MTRLSFYLKRLGIIVAILLLPENATALSVSKRQQQLQPQFGTKTTTTRSTVPPLFVSTTPKSFYETLSSSNDHVSIAQRLNVKPGMMDFSPRFWKFAWRMHGRLLPLLHIWDKARTADLDNCLKVLWCKALVGLDWNSPAYDGGLAYDMLPSLTRWLVKLPERVFPRLVHFIIELRTVYLDRALQEEMQHAKDLRSVSNVTQQQQNHTDSCFSRIRLVTLGAGYDTRSVKFLNDDGGCQIDEAWELDMQTVIASKSIMLERLRTRRPNAKIPKLVGQDLTDFVGTKRTNQKNGIPLFW
ncbi:leucine carboxyl methyltransferase [Nitzschia inconspicua]|uniref:Leucine carboxyl methyltransferase n=1 Tax=Nitzschia inconspicua TaxID=303405 RepID=A0A9K3LD73_9STRA|nr:leucine carboxyl methyltransferase [Nitzschia inconspicua]